METPKFHIKSQDEWKGKTLCEAVKDSVGELNFFINHLKGDGGCYICGGVSFATKEEIIDAVQHHSDYTPETAEKCLSILKKQHKISSTGGGYFSTSL